MKKTLSILLIVVMLFAVAATAIPASAAVSNPVTTLDSSKVGNTVITDANRAAYQQQLLAEGYIPLADTVWPDYDEIYGEGVVRAFNDIFEGGSKDIADGGKFFLIEDVVAAKTYNSRANTAEGHKNHWVEDFTLDGCGYSLTLNAPLFQVNYNTTMKNITLKGTLGHTSDKCGSFAAISMWESHGYCNFENVTSTITINTNNRATHQRMAALSISAESSTFKNVKVVGDHTLNADGGVMDNVGAFVGQTSGNTVFENCVSEGTTYINSAKVSRLYGLGGFVGNAGGTVKFINCINKRNIVISANTEFVDTNVLYDGCDKDGDGVQDTDTNKHDFAIGGFVGSIGPATFENCVNEGSFTIAGKFNVNNTGWKNADDSQLYLGGLIGTAGSGLVMKNCENKGAINVSIENTYTMNTLPVKDGNLEDTLAHRFALGGVVGSISVSAKLTDVQNTGKITLDKTCVSDMGGVVGFIGGTKATLTDVDNKGAIEFKNGAALDQGEDAGMGLGGIVGMSKANSIIFENCDNTAAITYANILSKEGARADGGGNPYYHTAVAGIGGILGYSYQSNTEEVALYNCHNTGAMTEASHATRAAFIGGIVGGVRGVTKFLAYNCSNSSNLATNHGGWASIGGIVGQLASVGNWMHSGNKNIEATFDIRGCKNTGSLSSGALDVGGMLGGNNEMGDALKLVMTFFHCENNGAVTGNRAGGIYGAANSKGYLNIEYSKNTGAIVGKKQAGGIVGSAENLTDVTIKNSQNNGTVTDPARAGGIAGTVNVTGKLSITDCYNSAKIKVNGSDGAHVASGILAYATASNAVIDKCVNKGTVECGNKTNQAAITVTQVTFTGTNYYLSGCVSGTSGLLGTAKNESEINNIVKNMVFALGGDPFRLIQLIDEVAKYIKSDYKDASWNTLTSKLNTAKTTAADAKASQATIDAAKKALEDAIASLDPKALDLTEYNKQVNKFKSLDKKDWDSNTYLEVKRAVEAADEIKGTPKALQSVFDKAVKLIASNIAALKPREDTQGEIDVDANGDFTLPDLRPTATQTQATTVPTETTPAETEPDVVEEEEEGGCGGIIGGAAIAVTAILAIGAGISLKKKEN